MFKCSIRLTQHPIDEYKLEYEISLIFSETVRMKLFGDIIDRLTVDTN